jgi:hypothetical protein
MEPIALDFTKCNNPTQKINKQKDFELCAHGMLEFLKLFFVFLLHFNTRVFK